MKNLILALLTLGSTSMFVSSWASAEEYYCFTSYNCTYLYNGDDRLAAYCDENGRLCAGARKDLADYGLFCKSSYNLTYLYNRTGEQLAAYNSFAECSKSFR